MSHDDDVDDLSSQRILQKKIRLEYYSQYANDKDDRTEMLEEANADLDMRELHNMDINHALQ